jgi:hypothetical protein
MAYTPTKWNNDDVITAEKLNKLEQGVKNEQVGPAGPAGAVGPAGPAYRCVCNRQDQQEQKAKKAIQE